MDCKATVKKNLRKMLQFSLGKFTILHCKFTVTQCKCTVYTVKHLLILPNVDQHLQYETVNLQCILQNTTRLQKYTMVIRKITVILHYITVKAVYNYTMVLQ